MEKPGGAPSAEEHWLWSDSSGPAPARKQKEEEPQVGSDGEESGEHQLFLEAPHG